MAAPNPWRKSLEEIGQLQPITTNKDPNLLNDWWYWEGWKDVLNGRKDWFTSPQNKGDYKAYDDILVSYRLGRADASRDELCEADDANYT